MIFINTSISMATESPIDMKEFFVGSKTMDMDVPKYPKGKTKIIFQSVELAERE